MGTEEHPQFRARRLDVVGESVAELRDEVARLDTQVSTLLIACLALSVLAGLLAFQFAQETLK